MKLFFELLPWIIAATAWGNCLILRHDKKYWKSEYVRVAKKNNEFLDEIELKQRKLKIELWMILILAVVWGAIAHTLFSKIKEGDKLK